MVTSTAEVHDRRVRVVAVSDESEQPPRLHTPGDVLAADDPSPGRRPNSATAFTLAWAASLPVAGGGLVWYAALHCFVC